MVDADVLNSKMVIQLSFRFRYLVKCSARNRGSVVLACS